MTFEEAVEIIGHIEPSEDEISNGWDIESLTIYLAGRELDTADAVLNPQPVKPTRTNNGLRWLR